LERITITATEVFMDDTRAEKADAVEDKDGLPTVLKLSPFRAWRKMSSEPDTKVKEWMERSGPCGTWSCR